MLPVSQISSVEIIIMKRVLEDPSRGGYNEVREAGRRMSTKSASALEGLDIKETVLETGFEIVVKTGQDSSMAFHTNRSITIGGELSSKRQNEVMKELYLCCVEDVLPQAEYAFEQFDQVPVKPWPDMLGKAAKSKSPKLDEVKREQ